MAPKKTRPLELGKWAIVAIFATIALSMTGLYFLSLIIQEVTGSPIPPIWYKLVVAMMLFITAFKLYNYVMSHIETPSTSPKSGLQATSSRTIPYSSNGRSGNLMMHAVQFAVPGLKSQPDQPQGQQGLDWWRYDNIVIDEDLILEFWRKGWNRQLLGDPHPFSQKKLTDLKFYSLGMTRMDPMIYKALVGLTSDYNLWLRVRRQGSSGRIRTRPGACLARMKGKW